MKVYSYPVTVATTQGEFRTTVQAVNRPNAVRMALVRADYFGFSVKLPEGATLGSVLRSGSPVKVGPGSFSCNA